MNVQERCAAPPAAMFLRVACAQRPKYGTIAPINERFRIKRRKERESTRNEYGFDRLPVGR